MIFSAEELYRTERTSLAIIMHKLPSEIDAAPYADIADVLEMLRANPRLPQGG